MLAAMSAFASARRASFAASFNSKCSRHRGLSKAYRIDSSILRDSFLDALVRREPETNSEPAHRRLLVIQVVFKLLRHQPGRGETTELLPCQRPGHLPFRLVHPAATGDDEEDAAGCDALGKLLHGLQTSRSWEHLERIRLDHESKARCQSRRTLNASCTS